ncbi:hypothetical protein B14_200152 (plasmid) [Bacillus licheniformis]|uniref:hypothetical protein n=1 Tax=Bacillus licheniformis TaxID=1402 RepID=UPI0009B7490F|nr:hypothetical protein [Bacillus licheniformis]ARC67363.1 hypothetical protein B14_200152 [Bacillus licheniformis]ARW46228.1 hypothetical protein S100141_05010 [Bacillus licheniformis]MDE1421796.1 hypothetical protein [Bacillus licheniformis]MEC0475801.1 hypothetical protein [Bacillus licheniformis]RHL11862.1 hypothetical protein DW032_19725 [Bacillus licheniformis]
MNLIEEYLSIHSNKKKQASKEVVLTNEGPTFIQIVFESFSHFVPATLLFGKLVYDLDCEHMKMIIDFETADPLIEVLTETTDPIEVIGPYNRISNWKAEGIITNKIRHVNVISDSHYTLELSLNEISTYQVRNTFEERYPYF